MDRFCSCGSRPGGFSPCHTDVLYREYPDLHPAFEEFVVEGREVLDKLGLDAPIADALYKIATENVKLPTVTIAGDLFLQSTKSDGVISSDVLSGGAEPKSDDEHVEIIYLGAPNYRIKVSAPNYKEAEKALEKASSAAIGVMKRAGGDGRFTRKAKAGKHV